MESKDSKAIKVDFDRDRIATAKVAVERCLPRLADFYIEALEWCIQRAEESLDEEA